MSRGSTDVLVRGLRVLWIGIREQWRVFTLAVIGVLTSVVGAYYYLMIVKTMYFDQPVQSFDAMPGLLRLVLAVSGVINLLFFAWPAPLLSAANAAAKSLF